MVCDAHLTPPNALLHLRKLCVLYSTVLFYQSKGKTASVLSQTETIQINDLRQIEKLQNMNLVIINIVK